ncbi:hypothetical protein AVEN_175645-1 [Araneus ventricosus]|uniref:Uncharacterized protein n=1 Tax=Araneus ventricosus TaxID=182803 RepID=A0A4Y2QNU5_ARAVE|nr:hypothetical protein AVEN_175645-1 [Araneus ventricosus]
MFVHKDLHTCTDVFIRIARVRKPLEPPYDGPSTVVKRHDKYFTVTIKGKYINIYVDRLKPAYLLLTVVDAPHRNKLDTAPTLPNETLTAHQETEKQQSDLLDTDIKKKLHALVDVGLKPTVSYTNVRPTEFAKCYSENLHLYQSRLEQRVDEVDAESPFRYGIYYYDLSFHKEESFSPWGQPQAFFAIHSPFNPINPVYYGHAIRSGFTYGIEVKLVSIKFPLKLIFRI